jgi:hypothetical protein
LHLEIECERKGVFYNYGRLMPLKKANKANMSSRRIISLDFIDMFIKDTSHEVKFQKEEETKINHILKLNSSICWIYRLCLHMMSMYTRS